MRRCITLILIFLVTVGCAATREEAPSPAGKSLPYRVLVAPPENDLETLETQENGEPCFMVEADPASLERALLQALRGEGIFEDVSPLPSSEATEAAGGQPGKPTKDTRFSFQAITESANALGETTGTLQSLLGDVRELLDSQSISQETDAVALAAGGIVDRAAKRIAQLLLLLFVLLLVYGVIRGKLLRSRRPKTEA